MKIIHEKNWRKLVAAISKWANACAVLLLLICSPGFAQIQTRNFRSISLEDGLSQSTVYSIVQDTLGFMWMATQDGLNRYDGKSFTVYHPVAKDSNSLLSNYIRTTFLDHSGQLWIGGDQGISRYNYATNTFKNYKPQRKAGEWYVSSITEDATHTLWMGTSGGEIFRLNTGQGQLHRFMMDVKAEGITNINRLCYYKGQLYVGTNVGLFTLSNANGLLQKINLTVTNPSINELFVDGEKLWIATEGSGLFCYRVKDHVLQQSWHVSGNTESLGDNDVRAINKDAQGNIWVGTFKGLSVLNSSTGKFENYYHQSSIPYTISQNSVRSIYRDRQQGMWLGTFYGGLSYYHEHDIKFSLLNQNAGSLSLNDQVINVIKQDKKGNFWIGTNDKGLNFWNRITNTIQYYSYKEAGINGLSSNNLKSITFDSKENVLIGTHNGGLNILNPITGQVAIYRNNNADTSSISGDMVYALLKDSKDRIWVGTRTGLDLFDEANQNFRHFMTDAVGKRLSSNETTYLMEDSKGGIWIGTTNGVNRYDPALNQLDVYPGALLSNEVVNCITEDEKHRIWIGTRNGLNLYNEKDNSFETSQTRNDFLKGTIYGIVPDDDGNIWMSTNRGLMRYNADARSLQGFDSKDGLQNNQFNLYAFCKATDGMLLFGGINGISYFYPSAIRQQPLQLQVTFTGLELYGKPIAVGDSTGLLAQHADKTNELILKHDQNQLTILFNTFNYISANRTQYFYRLKGLDTMWQQTDAIPKASYNNLQPGHYVLEVKAIGPNGEVSPVRMMNIHVLTPWYNSTWFYLLVSTLLGIGAYIAYRVILERIRTRQQLKIERMQREKGDYINQVKMDFFTNVSHELRTPLTLILAPLEEMMNRPITDKQLSKQYQTMYANARRLYQLVDQLFEFRKTELGTRKLKVSRGEMISFIEDIYLSFQPLAERNNIQYSYQAIEEKRWFLFDKDAMERILFNLLSNAFKYTPAGGEIKIRLSESNEQAVIKIADTGKGIEEEHLGKIFDRFYQVNNEEMNLGSGVGLAFTQRLVELHHGTITVESNIGKGSVFTVKIPLSDEYYRTDMQVTAMAAKAVAALVDNEYSVIEEGEEEVTETDNGIGVEKLLIVDDNHDIVNYLSDYFSRNYEVIIAYDGVQALAMLENQSPDMIISDVMMPEMDGLHFCKRVKKNIQTSHIPVLLLTAKSETSQQIKGLEMGADDYMTKPFSINLLEAKVENILRSRKRLKQYYLASKEVIPENMAFNTLDEDFLKQAISIVEENLLEPNFSVENFSRKIGMSRSNLYLKMKAITGESVTDFIKRIRFKKATELLEQRRYTIAEIAYMAGFNSPSYFSTAFKQYYDCMPTEYLAKNQLGKNVIE